MDKESQYTYSKEMFLAKNKKPKKFFTFCNEVSFMVLERRMLNFCEISKFKVEKFVALKLK